MGYGENSFIRWTKLILMKVVVVVVEYKDMEFISSLPTHYMNDSKFYL